MMLLLVVGASRGVYIVCWIVLRVPREWVRLFVSLCYLIFNG